MKTYGRKRRFQKTTQVDLDVGDVCRLCLCTSNDRQSIFDSEGDIGDVPLTAIILTCVSVEVYDGDGLPSELCLKCLKLLKIFYKFRKQCEKVNNKLHNIVKNVAHGKQEKVNIVEVLYRAGKEIQSEVLLDNATGVVDLLLNDSESIGENDNLVIQESSNSGINYLCQKNNNTNILDDCGQCEIVSESGCEEHCQWQSLDKSIIKSGHFRNCVNTFSSNENIPFDNEKSISSEDSLTNNFVKHSKSESSDVYKNLEQFPENSLGLIFMCDKCPKKFSKRIDLKRHSSVHVQQKGFECGVCEKWFPNKTSYKRHERIHTGERPFSCSYCQKCFSQESILSRHVLIHTGEKPYKCEMCGKGFYQREGLKVHMRRHDHSNVDEQQYYCPLCKKGFCHQSGLSRHLITHTGKTFDCSLCSKSYSDQSSLKRHSKRHNTVSLT